MGRSFSPPRVGGSDVVLHLDHRAVTESQAREELAHVGLAEVDQGGDLADGPELGDLEPPLPVVLARLAGELLVDADERVEVGWVRGANQHVLSAHRCLLVLRRLRPRWWPSCVGAAAPGARGRTQSCTPGRQARARARRAW